MNSSDIHCDSEFANSSNFSCVNRTVPSYSIIDIASFMHIFPTIYWHFVLRWSSGQRFGDLCCGIMQEEDGLWYLRAESGHRRPAFPVGDAVQHPSTGPGQTVGLWPLHV